MKFKNKLLLVIFLLLFQFFWNNVFSNLEIPDFQYELQRPSYIEETWSWTYLCDEEKDECKVNFKLVNEEEKDISSKYNCKIIADFEFRI